MRCGKFVLRIDSHHFVEIHLQFCEGYNQYLHFHTAIAGDIIIIDGALSKKTT